MGGPGPPEIKVGDLGPCSPPGSATYATDCRISTFSFLKSSDSECFQIPPLTKKCVCKKLTLFFARDWPIFVLVANESAIGIQRLQFMGRHLQLDGSLLSQNRTACGSWHFWKETHLFSLYSYCCFVLRTSQLWHSWLEHLFCYV